ncbi:MAG: hypothetical protein Q8L48_23920 [Archangium sp.]|nr:hypothetical protein [Archangium sp.]
MERWLSPRVGFALVAGLYLLSFPYHPGLRSPNELCRLWQSRAFVDFGTLHINGVLQQRGMVGDLSCTSVVRDAAGEHLAPCVGPDAPREGVVARWYYPSKAPLVSVLGAPVYWVQTKLQGQVSELSQVLWGRLFVTIFPALGLLVLLRKFLAAYVEPGTADLFTLVYALGTMAFSYAEAFMSHQLTAVLLFAAFYCAWKVERGEWKVWGYLLAGLAAGAAVTAEYTAALGVVCVAAYTVASRWKKWGALGQAVGLVVLGSAPLLGALLWYHAAVFGGPFVSGYKFLNDAAYMGWHQGGFLGIKWPDPRALGLSFFSPLRGLFALSPFLAVGFFGSKDVRAKDKPFFVLLVVLLATHAYFTSSFTYDSWGWTVGPRHLTGILPFLMLPVAMLYERLRTAAPLQASLVAGLCVSSVLATGLVGFVNYVPDDVTSSVWALALPLLADGFFPVSWLAAWIPNPASGAVLVVLLLALVAWLFTRFLKLGATPFLLVVVVVLHFGALRVLPMLGPLPKADEHDRGAKGFLESVWVAPRGVQVPFKP